MENFLTLWYYYIHCGGEDHVRIVYTFCFCLLSCVMCWFGCVVLLVCGLDKIGQERSTYTMKWNEIALMIIQIADPTYWFRRNEEIRAVRSGIPQIDKSLYVYGTAVTLTMPTLTFNPRSRPTATVPGDPIVKMVLEIGFHWTSWKRHGAYAVRRRGKPAATQKTIDLKVHKQ